MAEDVRFVTAARAWFAAIALAIAVALAIQFVSFFTGGAEVNTGARGTDVSLGVRIWRGYSFFTVESNIVVLIVSIMIVIHPLRSGRWWEIARLNALVAITITGLVFATVLAPLVTLTGWSLLGTVLFHYVSPWDFVIGWLIFGPRPRFAWSTIPGAFILPIVWLVYIFVQGAFTNWYPYSFLDVTVIGFGRAALSAVLVLLVGVVIAAILKLIDVVVPSPLTGARTNLAGDEGGP